MGDQQTLTDVLIECVKAAGGSKVVGSRLWPERGVEQAQRRLLDCLNDDRADRLSPEQVLLVAAMARDAGCHAYMAYLAVRLHYQPPVPHEPRDELAELQRAFVASVAQQAKILEAFQAMGGIPPVASLKAVA